MENGRSTTQIDPLKSWGSGVQVLNQIAHRQFGRLPLPDQRLYNKKKPVLSINYMIQGIRHSGIRGASKWRGNLLYESSNTDFPLVPPQNRSHLCFHCYFHPPRMKRPCFLSLLKIRKNEFTFALVTYLHSSTY